MLSCPLDSPGQRSLRLPAWQPQLNFDTRFVQYFEIHTWKGELCIHTTCTKSTQGTSAVLSWQIQVPLVLELCSVAVAMETSFILFFLKYFCQ